MSPVGQSLERRFAALLEDMREHERGEPHEVAQLVGALIAHVRAWRPESVSPLGTLPPPGEQIRDPRKG